MCKHTITCYPLPWGRYTDWFAEGATLAQPGTFGTQNLTNNPPVKTTLFCQFAEDTL